MRTILVRIIITIICLFDVYPVFSQDIMPNAGLSYEIRHVFTGKVNVPLDSVFMDICIIYNAQLTGNEQLQIARQNDTINFNKSNKNGIMYIANKGLTLIPLGYTDPYNPALKADIIFDNAKKINAIYAKITIESLIIDNTLVQQLKRLLDNSQNK